MPLSKGEARRTRVVVWIPVADLDGHGCVVVDSVKAVLEWEWLRGHIGVASSGVLSVGCNGRGHVRGDTLLGVFWTEGGSN